MSKLQKCTPQDKSSIDSGSDDESELILDYWDDWINT